MDPVRSGSTSNGMEKIISLCKRRGFIFPGSEIYGGLANSWDYGPLGAELKNNIKQEWWKRFVHQRADMVGIDAALIMNPKVWEASGHVAGFSDPLAECKKCHNRFRADQLAADHCPNCEGQLAEAKQFNLMFKTFMGPAEEKANVVYLRPETAQAMFVNFKNILDTTRRKLPFGIAQMGKAFRNEITPGNFIFRTREFEQMEIEYFVRESEWEKHFEHWLEEMKKWLAHLGVSAKKVHYREIPKEERAHYSKRTVDIEYEYPFGQKELWGLAYRTDYDLKNHSEKSGKDLSFIDEAGDRFFPHVIEPSMGVERTLLAILCSAYFEDKDRVVLKLKPVLAPYKAAVFPLLANKPELVKKAREVFEILRLDFAVAWDDRGNIGKRYYSQDEIGTVTCVTCDFQTLEDNTVTLRDRDTTKQERIEIKDVADFLKDKLR